MAGRSRERSRDLAEYVAKTELVGLIGVAHGPTFRCCATGHPAGRTGEAQNEALQLTARRLGCRAAAERRCCADSSGRGRRFTIGRQGSAGRPTGRI